MTTPVTIPELDPAGPIDPNNDYLLIRQGLNDRKATAAQISNPVLGSLDMLPGQLVASDVLLVGRNTGPGPTYSNYIVPPQYLGFLNGTRMWFYQASAPLGWTIIPGTGDRLLAVATPAITPDPAVSYNLVQGGGQAGTWQQGDVGGVLNAGLAITQIPNHRHFYRFGKDQSDSNAKFVLGAQNLPTAGNPRFGNTVGVVGGAGDNANHENDGVCDPHNHGNVWRPLANVGILCIKDKLVGA